MSWFGAIISSVKQAQQAASTPGNKGAAASPKATSSQHRSEKVIDLNSSTTGARDPAQVEAEQSRQKGTREQEAELQRLHKQFVDQVASGVENRMHRLGLRSEDPRNKIINRVYGKYLGIKDGSKLLSAEEYAELIDAAKKLSALADEIQKRQAPTDAERAAFAHFARGYDIKSGNPLMASIDGASGELDEAQKKERDEFYLSRASIVPILDKPAASSDMLAVGDRVFEENDWRPYSQSGWTGDPNFKGGIDCSDFVSEYLRENDIEGDWDSDGLYARTGALKDKVEGTYFKANDADLQRAQDMLQPGDYIAYPDSNGKDGHCGYMTADGMIAQSGKGGVSKRTVASFFRAIDRRGANFMIGRLLGGNSSSDTGRESVVSPQPTNSTPAPAVNTAADPTGANNAVIIDSRMTRAEALRGTSAPEHVKRDLELVDVQYIGFDRKLHQGQVVIHKDLKTDIEGIFGEILASGCPIEKVVPIVKYDWSDSKSIKNNNSSGFNYRDVIDPDGARSGLSHHAGGEGNQWGAIDVNPEQNPFVGASGKAERSYDKSGQAEGTITHESPIYKAFVKYGWSWGGDWSGGKDYQHFEKQVASAKPRS